MNGLTLTLADDGAGRGVDAFWLDRVSRRVPPPSPTCLGTNKAMIFIDNRDDDATSNPTLPPAAKLRAPGPNCR